MAAHEITNVPHYYLLFDSQSFDTSRLHRQRSLRMLSAKSRVELKG